MSFRRLLDLLPGARRARVLDPYGHCLRRDPAAERPPAAELKAQRRLGVVLTFGQSQLANEGAEDAQRATARTVYALNIFDHAVTRARDPLAGSTQRRANLSTRIGDRLVTADVFPSVLLVPIAYGGTSVSEWTAGGRLFPRIVEATQALRARGLRVSCALWQQGETDAMLGMTGGAWAEKFRAMIAAMRGLGVEAPVFVAQSTLCCGPPNEAIRAAQRAVVEPSLGVFAGPDTDAIGAEMRYDGCHFSAAGLDRAADLWLAALTAEASPLTRA